MSDERSVRAQEQEKWERYYAALPLMPEDDSLRQSNQEFARHIGELLPVGSHILELGCGGGWQSVGLAKSGMFRLTLADFSPAALNYARRVFEQVNCPAQFIDGDAFTPGQPEYDLVFNAGSLEHYSFEDQVQFVRGMASRSRRYVVALVPNGLCYWYWLWRVRAVSQGGWPYGKEVPIIDFSRLFEAAGLHFAGQAFMGESWTDEFIRNLDGLSDSLKSHILEIHQSSLLIPSAQKSYLVAALGVVSTPADTAYVSSFPSIPALWKPSTAHQPTEVATLNAALADALALRIGADNQLREARERISAQDKALQELRVQLQQVSTEQERLGQHYAQEINQREMVNQRLQAEAQEARSTFESLQVTAANSHAALEGLQATLEDLHAKNEGLQTSLQRLNAEIESLNHELEDRQNETQRIQNLLNEEIRKRDEILEGLSTQLLNRDQSVELLAPRLEAREKLNHVLINQLDQTTTLLQSLQSALESQKQTIQALNVAVQDRDRAAAQLNAQIQQQTQIHQSLTAHIQERDQRLHLLNAQLQEQQRTVQTLTGHMERQQQTITTQNERLQNLQMGVRSLRETLASSITHVDLYRGGGMEKTARFVQRLRRQLLLGGPRGWIAFMQWLTGRGKNAQNPFDYLHPIRDRMQTALVTTESLPLLGSLNADASTYLPTTPETQLALPTPKNSLPAKAFHLTNALPLISVMLPVYNHADMIGGAIQSILAQDYPNWELILLDDGSEDDLEGALKPFAGDHRIRFYRQRNQRLPRALTHLGRLAQGEWITWTSADNLLAPGMLSSLAAALLLNPEAVLVYADVAVIDDNGQALIDRSYRNQNCDPIHPDWLRLYRHDTPLGWETDNYINACFMYRSKAAQALNHRYADDLNGLEDYDYWLRLQKAGKLLHINNEQPLYFYRVHQRTMSHELLSKQRERHLQRGQMLIDLERSRREFCMQPYQVDCHASLEPEERTRIQELAVHSPYSVLKDAGAGTSAKLLRFLDSALLPHGATGARGSAAQVYASSTHWILTWNESGSQNAHWLRVPRGVVINPLAYKTREYRPTQWDPLADIKSPILGCHLGGAAPIDLERCRALISAHPNLFFVFVDAPDSPNKDSLQALIGEMPNTRYLNGHAVGCAYQIYASFTCWWVPPLKTGAGNSDQEDGIIQESLSLAYMTGRWLIIPQKPINFETMPFVWLLSPEGNLRDAVDFIQAETETHSQNQALYNPVLTSYLQTFSPQGRFDTLLRLANTIDQNDLPRPDFGSEIKAFDLPQLWQLDQTQGRPANISTTNHKNTPPKKVLTRAQKLRVLLHVETLDRGGLEQMVMLLAESLHTAGHQVQVLCAQSGGLIADQINNKGIPVFTAQGDLGTLCRIVDTFRPDIVHTEYGFTGLEYIHHQGIPVIETIQNMYVYYDESQWRREQEKSRWVSHYIAVSAAVRDYFLRNMPKLPSDRVSVIPNWMRPERLQPISRETARKHLNLGINDFVFLNLATYDGRKNQLGLLTAFDQVAREFPSARLVCAGNIASPAYYERVKAYRASLTSAGAIILNDYMEDVNAYFSAADCFVLNSVFEGWSVAATEALSYGLPLIHSECGSAWELCGSNEERGIVVPNPVGDLTHLDVDHLVKVIADVYHPNTEPLITALKRMIREQRTWANRADAIRVFAKGLTSADTFADSHYRLYEQFLPEVHQGQQQPV